jgi:hypothetical protein
MGLYVWKCSHCLKEVQVIRPVAEIDIEPTDEERECTCASPQVRIICAPQKFVRGANWNYQKGGHN